jgi:hypothetical protein
MKKYIKCCRDGCEMEVPIDRCVIYIEGAEYVCNVCCKKEQSPDIYEIMKDWADRTSEANTKEKNEVG